MFFCDVIIIHAHLHQSVWLFRPQTTNTNVSLLLYNDAMVTVVHADAVAGSSVIDLFEGGGFGVWIRSNRSLGTFAVATPSTVQLDQIKYLSLGECKCSPRWTSMVPILDLFSLVWLNGVWVPTAEIVLKHVKYLQV